MRSISPTDVTAAPPLACIPDAIPLGERRTHFERATRLFARESREKQVLPTGYAFRFDAGALDDLARWVAHERRCCPFLSFTLEVAPGGGLVWIRLTGPEGTHAFLDAQLPAPGSTLVPEEPSRT
jgi:hypothetical protein